MKPACLGMILIACCLAQPPLLTEKASVSGSVTSIAGDPLRRVTLRLNALPGARGSSTESLVSNATAETDSQGNFAFDEVVPGRYMLRAERSGFLGAGYWDDRGPVLTINPGQKTTGIVIKMTPQGVIAGRVIDDEKEPLPGAIISVRMYSVPGQRQRMEPPGSRGTTDADGAFAIGNLIPGRYVVSVAAPPSAASPVKSRSLLTHPEMYVTTYYPDATDISGATPVELSAGEQARGLEIQLQRVPVFKLSGKLVNAITGEPSSADTLNLIRQGSGPPGLRSRSTGVRSGEFSFDEVLPGTYVLEAQSAGETETNRPLVGRQIIALGNGDLDRVILEMKPGIEMRGSVIVEGSPVSSWPRISLTPTEGLNNLDFATMDEDGHFALTGLEPAQYRVNVSSIPPPMFVKSIRFNGQDIVDALVDLGSAATASLDIVISDRLSSISGIVTDSSGAPVGLATVLAQSRKTEFPRRTETDENGRFSFARVPPGEYIMMASKLFGPGQLGPSELFEKLGKAITVGEGVSVAADLRLITMDDVRAAGAR